MSEYLVDIKNERLSFFTPAGEVKAVSYTHLDVYKRQPVFVQY